jgi:hypothetical protein
MRTAAHRTFRYDGTRLVEDSGEAERRIRDESERYSGINPDTVA